MATAIGRQQVQDWITQQWVILFGKKIDGSSYEWLLGPFGPTKPIGLDFVNKLAKDEGLIIINEGKGLIRSIDDLGLSTDDLDELSPHIIDFYENTANYQLDLKIEWNLIFKPFGYLVNEIFSQRIKQLNIPINDVQQSKGLTSEIIHLSNPVNNEIKRTFWIRSYKYTNQIVYLGIYELCTIPSGKKCIKAIFPLPNGNATVILDPTVNSDKEFVLLSSGKEIGDCGFYFLLKDSNGAIWTKFIKSFQDKLVMKFGSGELSAIQSLTLWGITVLRFLYTIKKK